jgi:serine/threonine protein kinase
MARMQAAERQANDANLQENSCGEEGLPRTFERFTLLKRVARGGMGEVYLATAGGIEGAERPVVIKLIRRDHDTDSSFLARFLDEARIQSQLHHPAVAQVLEATRDGTGKPYVVVEYVEGRNLSDVRTRATQLGVRIAWPEALALAITLGDALAHIHERTDAEGRPLDIVHRDLSPQNVMVGYGGDVKLIDFGTARGENRRCHTISGVVFAKPGYVAPEVANNTPGGVPADLYAFGVILWELLAGRRFLVGEPAAHLAAVGSGRKVPTAIAQAVGAPPEIDAIIEHLTAPRIEDRMPSARKATAELVRILQRAPSLADGDRSLRGRIAHLMRSLYPSEPARSRAEFQSLLARAQKDRPAPAVIPPSPPPPAPGEPMLPGTRYRIERELGRGAMGVVYEAVHVDLGRRVALKVLGAEYGNASAQARFVEEARAVAGIEHDGLVRLYEFGFSADGKPFYAMELVAGETLDQLLARRGALPLEQAIERVIEVCGAVEAAHAADVVHRDIKPSNLLVSESGQIKLLDFGIAKPGSEIDAREEGETGALVLIGTPEYMAPEQALGKADVRSDVYALGAVLYELCTGTLPHKADGAVALLEKKQNVVPVAPSVLVKGAKRSLDRVVLKALAADPDQRFQTVAELREALFAVLTSSKRSERTSGYARTAALSLVAFVLSLGGGLVVTNAGIRGAALDQGSALVSKAKAAGERVRSSFGAKEAGQGAALVKAEPVAPVVAATPAVVTPVPSVAVAVVEPTPADAADATDAAELDEEASDAVAEALAVEGTEGGEQSPEPTAAPSDRPTNPKADAAVSEFEALWTRGSTLKALKHIRTAARTFPEDPRVLQHYVTAARHTKAWGEAHRVAESWVKAAPSFEARLELARLSRATGQRGRALSILRSLAKEQPDSEELKKELAVFGGEERVARR